MVGYSRLIGEDETYTLRRFKALRHHEIDPRIKLHGGRTVTTTGDGVLVEFPSAVEAVAAAVDVQRAIAKAESKTSPHKRIAFRIGIHVGDVLAEKGYVFGNGVNVATRLEALAEAGGIAISHTVRDQIGDKPLLKFDDLGERVLKNIATPVRVFSLSASAITGHSVAALGQPVNFLSSRGDSLRKARASIAVLPFKPLGPEQIDDYFADGIVEDIITALCHFTFLFVIARNTSFTYKGRLVDVRQVARELGVRYVIDGTVRHRADRIRVTVDIIDAVTARNLFAAQFDEEASDIFELQDSITRQIVTSIEPKVRTAEIERAKRKPTASLDAYDYYLRALPYRFIQTADATQAALQLLKRSIELDPHYAPALALAACCYQKLHDQGYASLGSREIKEGLRLAREAINADMDDAVALCQAGHVLTSLTHDTGGAVELIDRAIRINPNLAEAWMRSSWVRISAGRLEEAIDHAERAIQLNPLDPSIFIPLCAKGYACLFLHRFDEAADCGRLATSGKDVPEMAYRLLIVALERLRRKREMLEATKAFRKRFPRFTIRDWSARAFYANTRQLAIITAGLKRAGLPE
jgi:adenylate cyclase